MKNEVLLSTILLFNPVSNVTAQEVGIVRTAVSQSMQYLADMVFESPEVKTGIFYRYNSETRQSEEFKRNYRVRVKFVISRNIETSSYSYNGQLDTHEMDYEAIVEKVDAETEEVLLVHDTFYFVKRLSKNKFRFFDCNSTLNCWDQEDDGYQGYADLHIFNTPEGRILKTTRNSSHTFDEYVFEDRVLFEK
jgi:hypothetical protein